MAHSGSMAEHDFEPKEDDLSTVLGTARARAGADIVEVAERAGLSAKYIAELEAGQRLPSASVAGRICAALSLNAAERELLWSATTRPGLQKTPWRGDKTVLSAPMRGWQAT